MCHKEITFRIDEIFPFVLEKGEYFLEKVGEITQKPEIFIQAIYSAVTLSPQFRNLGKVIYNFNGNGKKEKISVTPSELNPHQKAEVIFLEKLSRSRKREKLVFQYPLPSLGYKPRIIVPDISEFPEDWQPSDYSEISDLKKFDEYPKRIFEVKRNGTYNNSPAFDTDINIVLYGSEKRRKSDRFKQVARKYKKRGYELWYVVIDKYKKVITNPRRAEKYVRKL